MSISSKKIAVILLAAGYGSRFRPLTHYLPKPLCPVLNQSLIMHHLDFLRSYSYEIVINLGFHAQALMAALVHREQKISFLYEGSPLGVMESLKTIAQLKSYEGFFILSTDIYYEDQSTLKILFEQKNLAALVDNTGDYAGAAFCLREHLTTQKAQKFSDLFEKIRESGHLHLTKNFYNVGSEKIREQLSS